MNKKILFTIPFLFTAFACSTGVAYSGSNVETINDPAHATAQDETKGSMNESFNKGDMNGNFNKGDMEKGNIARVESISGNSITLSAGRGKKGKNFNGSFTRPDQEMNGEFTLKEKDFNSEKPARNDMNQDGEGSIRNEKDGQSDGTRQEMKSQKEDTVSEATKEDRSKTQIPSSDSTENGMKGQGNKNRDQVNGDIEEFKTAENTVTYTLSNNVTVTSEKDGSALSVTDLKAGDLIKFEVENNTIVKIEVLNGMPKGDFQKNQQGSEMAPGKDQSQSAEKSDQKVGLHTRNKNEDADVQSSDSVKINDEV